MIRSKAIVRSSVLAVGALLLCGWTLLAQDNPKPEVRQATGFAISPPLRELSKLPTTSHFGFHEATPVRRFAKRSFSVSVDPVEQSSVLAGVNYSIGLNLLGIGNGFPNFSVGGAPPDANLAVGDTQVVQWVMPAFAVFDKTSGAVLAGPILGNTLWRSLGGPCANNNDGDSPSAQWDRFAHRWFLAQNTFENPYTACIAISQTPDALGSYYLFAFSLGNGFPDYPKYGAWTVSWAETMNNFGPNGSGFQGPEVCVYDRNKLLAGDPSAGQVCFQLAPDGDSLLPADIDSIAPPPSGEDQFFIGSLDAVDNSHLSLYSVHIDWSQPQNATITGNHNSQLIQVPTYTGSCNGQFGGNCVPQKGVSAQLDSLGDRLMYRFAYWDDGPLAHVGAHAGPLPQQHWYVNSAVEASGGQIGERWYEFRAPVKTVPVTSLTLFQSGTYSPDSNYRWMGSVAQDKMGDVLLGYSICSANTYPSIGIAGRESSDPLGSLEDEVVVVSGNGSQEGSLWGAFSSMRIDNDGCTFWYTQEYYTVTLPSDWSTRLNSANFAGCH